MPRALSRREARKVVLTFKRKLADAEDVNYLNITAMMDMMTILLVFLLKSFSVSASNVQLNDVEPPKSTTELSAAEALKVVISSRAVLVDGEAVVPVSNGAIDPALKENGANGFLILPLKDIISKHAQREKKIAQLRGEEFKGELSLIADKGTPYRLITEVLYTAGQAEYRNYRLVVQKPGD